MIPKPLPNACYTVDPEADAAHIYLDFAADGRLLGIEILDSRHLPKAMKDSTP